jgi:predicted Rossmann fold flavoprotein
MLDLIRVNEFDLIIIGAGAAGFMTAITAGNRAKTTLLLDHSNKIGEKIRISGGGRCNFTNLNASFENYISSNLFFARSALAGYTPHDFIALLEKHKIQFHEKKLGQLFCDQGSFEIIEMLKKEINNLPVRLLTNTKVLDLEYRPDDQFRFELKTENKTFLSKNLVIASGGLSIPQIGASDFGYKVAKKFGINLIEPRPALVPFVFNDDTNKKYNRHFFANNAGLSFYADISTTHAGKKISFRENLLFTHKGLSGPAILQISSYWSKGQEIVINLSPNQDVFDYLQKAKKKDGKKRITSILKDITYPDDLHTESKTKLNRRAVFTDDFIKQFPDLKNIPDNPIAEIPEQMLQAISKSLNAWSLIPDDTEGFSKAEVTAGGIDTNELSSKTMESKKIPGLYFIGEVVDVTGWLGGYNFQWAWASGFAAGNAV